MQSPFHSRPVALRAMLRTLIAWNFILLWIQLITCTGASDVGGHSGGTGSLVAVVDMQGFRGTVEFYSEPGSDPFKEVMMRVNLRGPDPNKLAWSIWSNPADLTERDPCDADKLGKQMLDLSGMYGHIRVGKPVLIHDTFRALHLAALFERTLLVQSVRFGLRACAVVRSSVPLTTYEARFLSPVGGHLVIRQLPNLVTSVRADLVWTDARPRKTGATRLQWMLVKARAASINSEGQPPPGLDDADQSSAGRLRRHTCSYLWELISADLTDTIHASDAATALNVGGLAPRSTTRSRRTFAAVTTFTSLEALDLTDTWAVLRWSSDEFVACAPLWTTHPREAVAEFSRAGYVRGYVHFYQASGYGEATVVTVNLTLPHRNAAGFGIDALPLVAAVDSSTSASGQSCVASLGLKYYNPLEVDVTVSPRPQVGTTDRYAVGDLGGAMGSLLDRDHVHATFYDQYLTLDGPHGVVGRSLVIYEDNWYPLACANLRTMSAELEAVAVFQGGALVGRVTFRQQLSEPLGVDGTVHVALRHRDKQNSTSNHNWKIHAGPEALQQQSTVTESGTALPLGCHEAGPVFNPFGVAVSTAAGYDCNCGPATPMRCANGDLGGRLGSITIGESAETAESHGGSATNGEFFSDSTLWLGGDFSVTYMTLVIYETDYDDTVLACAQIVPTQSTHNDQI